MKRTIVFGDIHGCWREWEELLDHLAVSRGDRLISVGDLVGKGPSTRRTLELARSLKNLTCLAGNHEWRYLEAWRQGRKPDDKAHDLRATRELGGRFDEWMAWIATWPLFLALPELVVVHGGLRPGVPLARQTPEDLLNLRTVGKLRRPWYNLYRGPGPVVFGHWVMREPLVQENALGIDTGCVYGGRLTAVVFPGRHIFQVEARETYARKKGGWDR